MDSTPTTAIVVAAGVFDLAFAVFHLAFWRLLRWPGTLRASGEVNAAVTQTLNVMLTYCFVASGGWIVAAGVRGGPPPTALLLGAAGFWLLRALVQPLLFGMRDAVSGALTAAFALGVVLHAAALAV